MKQVLIRQGRVVVEEMHAPACGDGEVLVRSAYSLISAGTETSSLQSSEPPPAGSRWKNRARKLGEVVRMAARRGLKETNAAVRARLEGPSHVTGYSLAGTVLEVGSDVADLVPGQRVACAGASSAHHAEIVAVPRNLVVPVPDGQELRQAACVTLGAIALQGVRQADLRLGEIVCVMGLGLVGQLSVALLRASGCRVLGTDVDRGRVERAVGLGLERGWVAGAEDVERGVAHATAGRGVDAAILTAGSESSELIRQAVGLLRRRGRVVVVGSVGMELDRAPFYMKEAELRISCSYGPGRYDPAYEEQGRDYPYEYVRWTENRNMAEFLRLATEGEIPVEALLDRTFPIGEADRAYRCLTDGPTAKRPLGVLLEYPAAAEQGRAPGATPRVAIVPRTRAESGLGVALVGPGSFAREVHLPNLAELAPAAALRAVVGRSANSAREMARRHAAAYAATDLQEILDDEQVGMVLICTRHDLHADQSARALRAGKAVFCEKPAALDLAGLRRLEEALQGSDSAYSLGLNRRFAPDVLHLRRILDDRRGPLIAEYRVNAGMLPADHWALGPQGGGRLIGEACHMIDLLGHLVGSPRTDHALKILAPPAGDLPRGDNFSLTCRYADGSLATLIYTSLGHETAGKERIELHWDGLSAELDDFRRLTVHGLDEVGRAEGSQDKGHRELLRRFIAHASGGGPEPIPLGEILDVSRFVLQLDREARGAANASD